MHLRRQTIFRDFPMVLLDVLHGFTIVSTFLLDSSIVLLDFFHGFAQFFFCFTRFFQGFDSIFPWFSFTPFFHGLPNFHMVLLNFSMDLPWFYSTSPQFYPSIPVSPNAPRRTDQGGIDTPPSPNCHLLHNPQKAPIYTPLTAPNSVIYPQTPRNSLCSQKELRLA